MHSAAAQPVRVTPVRTGSTERLEIRQKPKYSPVLSLIAVFLFTLLIRLAFVLWVPVKSASGGDSVVYEQAALNLLHEGVLRSQEGYGARAPLYSLFIAGLYAISGENREHLFVAQALLSAAGVTLLFHALRYFLFPASLVGALFASLYPMILFYTKQALTECLYTFLLLLSVVLAYRALQGGALRAVFTGIALGLTILCRSEAAVLAVFFLIGLAGFAEGSWRRRARLVSVTAVTVALVVLPWLIRNRLVLGSPVLASEAGATLYLGQNPGATGGYYVLPELPNTPVGEMQLHHFYYDRAMQFILQQPLASFALIPKKFVVLWAPFHNRALDGAEWLLLPLAVAGLILGLRDRSCWRYAYFLAVPIVAVHITTSIFIAGARYRAPLAPFLIAFAALAVATWLSWAGRRMAGRAFSK